MIWRRLPTGPRRLIRMLLLAGLALAPAPLAAQTQELKSSIDRAGSAASRQIGDWLGGGAPAKPARKTRTRPATSGRPTTSPRPVPASIPLPTPRPAEAGERAEAPEAVTETPAERVSSSLRPAAPPLAGAPRKPPAEPAAAPVEETPDLAEAPGVPLPPRRPDRVAMVMELLESSGPANVPRPPHRPEATAPAMAKAEAPTTGPFHSTANVPLPPSRPGSAAPAEPQTAMLTPPAAAEPALAPPPGPAAGCPELSVGDIGTFATAEVKMAPACRIERPVSLTGIRLKDGRLVPLEPAATLRCDMAAAVARWVRDGVAPAVATLGSPLAKIEVADSYSCRPRNRVKGAKISEHGQGNAMDTRGYTLMDGRRVVIGGKGEQAMPVAFQERLKATACADFMTILGPGSDGYHELHLHVDRAFRRNNMVLCRWAIRGSTGGSKRAGTGAPAPAPVAAEGQSTPAEPEAAEEAEAPVATPKGRFVGGSGR